MPTSFAKKEELDLYFHFIGHHFVKGHKIFDKITYFRLVKKRKFRK